MTLGAASDSPSASRVALMKLHRQQIEKSGGVFSEDGKFPLNFKFFRKPRNGLPVLRLRTTLPILGKESCWSEKPLLELFNDACSRFVWNCSRFHLPGKERKDFLLFQQVLMLLVFVRFLLLFRTRAKVLNLLYLDVASGSLYISNVLKMAALSPRNA